MNEQMRIHDLHQTLTSFVNTDRNANPNEGYKSFPILLRMKDGSVKMISAKTGICLATEPIMIQDPKELAWSVNHFLKWPMKGFYLEEL